MKRVILILLMAILVTLVQAIQIGSELQKKLTNSAIRNIGFLPKRQKKSLNSLLKKYPDGLMAYLLASEESAKLLLANPKEIEQHYQWLIQNYGKEEAQLSINDYLSYIAKITVSDERIAFYREEMGKKGLYEIREKYTNPEDRVRALNLWCKNYLTFESTSGRDLSPLDILNKTNVGRCEESQIFFIAAARTIGIPSRPAFTPWWAHIDNNHAWAEVYINGKWYYLGACEPDYDLNHSWFTDLIDKAVLVVSEGSLPDPSEEILIKGKYQSYINSTRIYQSNQNRVRKVTFLTKQNNQVKSNTAVKIMVYNWASLRSLMEVMTDSTGQKDISVGQGAFFLIANHEDKFACEFIPESPRDTIIVLNMDSDTFKDIEVSMTYPKQTEHKWTSNADYEAEREKVNKAYSSLIIEQKRFPLPDGEIQDSLFMTIWDKCRFNKMPFYLFYTNEKPKSEFLTLLNQIDIKFFYQANEDQYKAVYSLYKSAIKDRVKIEESIFINLLTPTVYFEEIPLKGLNNSWGKWRNGNIEERITKINDKMKSKFIFNHPEKTVIGLLPVDEAIKLRYLSETQYKMILISVCRLNYIPAQLVELPGSIAIYYQDKWQYYDFKLGKFLNDSEETEVKETKNNVEIEFKDDMGQNILLEENQLQLTVFRDGYFYSNEEQLTSDKEYVYRAYLKPGNYQIQAGYRLNGEETRYNLYNINITDESLVKRSFLLKNYPYQWKELPEELNHLVKLIDNSLLDKNQIVIFGDYEREMVHRLYNRVCELKQENNCVWIGSQPASEKIKSYLLNKEYKQLLLIEPIYKSKIITLYFNQEQKKWFYFNGMWDQLPK